MKQAKKKRLILISSVIAMAVMLAVGSTAAFLAHQSQDMTNNFTPGTVSIDTEENSSDTPESSNVVSEFPDSGAKKEVQIKNTGNIDAYVRVKLVPSWKYTDTESMAHANAESFPLSMSEPVENIIDCGGVRLVLTDDWNSDWIYKDGTFYYKAPVKPGAMTTLLLKEVQMEEESKFDDLQVDVISEAIQKTDGAEQTALTQAWGSSFEFDAQGNIVSID